jgi:Na+-driven multidrug efflux pump
VLVALNGNLASLLHASRNVGEPAVINVAAKILWSVGMGLALVLHAGLLGLVAAFLISEAARAAALVPLARRRRRRGHPTSDGALAPEASTA